MKPARSNKNNATADNDWMTIAKAHEREGELAEAATAYEKLAKTHPFNEKVYDRIMMIYRQLKEYKKELAIINSAITVFENNYNKKHRPPGKKVTQLSNALLKATGLADKKGNSVYEPGPLARWKKRKMAVMKRLKK
jgi:tetratricopeptide (TPR) repeat protein